MREQKRHQGEILVEMGALSPHNLERALVGQMEAKLYEVFSWRTGSFRFTEDRAAPDQPVSLERPPAALILEGIRRHYEPERQNQVLAAFAGQFVAPSEDARQRLQNMSSDPAESAFVGSIDGTRKLESVLEWAPISVREARLLLVAMAEAGMIVPAKNPVRRPDQGNGGLQDRQGAPPGSGGRPGAATTRAAVIRGAARALRGDADPGPLRRAGGQR